MPLIGFVAIQQNQMQPDLSRGLLIVFPLAAVVAQRQSKCLMLKRSWVKIPPDAGLLFLINVNLNKSLEEMWH